MALRTDHDTVLATQTLTDALGTYQRQSLGVPQSLGAIRAFGIGSGGDLPLTTATAVTSTDRSDLLALTACVSTGTQADPAPLDLVTGIAPLRAGLVRSTRWTTDGGLFRANAVLQHGNGENWYLLHDGLGTLVQCDRAMRPMRALRFDGFGLAAGTPMAPLLLGSARAFVTGGVRAQDGALYHLVISQNGATLRSQTYAGVVAGPVESAFSEAFALANGCYATRHRVQPVQGAARTVLCVFGPDHVPLSITENGTTDDVAFVPSGTGYTSAPICAAEQQWQPQQVTLTPGFAVDAAGLRGKVDAQGTVLLSTNAASGNSMASCLGANFTHRWTVELLAGGWTLLALSPAAVLLGNQTAAPGLQGVILLDRGSGAVLQSHYFAAAASSVVQASFANDGLGFVLTAQSVSSRFVVAPGGNQPLRAFEVTTPNPIPVGPTTHDAATDLFTVPLVDGRTLFASASALANSAASLPCLPTVTLEALPLPANPWVMGVQTMSLPSLPKLPRAASEPLPLPLTGTAVQVELLTTDVPVLPICR